MAWFKSKTERLADSLQDERLYTEAALEVAEGRISAGLWAKAFAQSQGNEQVAKAAYIKLRVEQIRLGVAVVAELASQAKPQKQLGAAGWEYVCGFCGSTDLRNLAHPLKWCNAQCKACRRSLGPTAYGDIWARCRSCGGRIEGARRGDFSCMTCGVTFSWEQRVGGSV